MPRLSRREMLAGLLGTSAGLLAGCEGHAASLPPAGEILGPPNYAVGHRIRDGFRPRPANDRWQETDVVVIGGGMSGLAAAWTLKRSGLRRFVILELEVTAGGTSRSGRRRSRRIPGDALCPRAAAGEPLADLLSAMGVIERVDAAGVPVVAEQYLCRDPGERLFVDGAWYEGLSPLAVRDAARSDQPRDFRAEIARWVQWRDGKGRRAFAIPVPHGSDDPEVTTLDGLSMAEWVRQHGWTSPRLLWLIDYSCRDDYGATSEQTSRVGRTVLLRVAGPRARERIAAAHHLAGGQRPDRALPRRPRSQPTALRDGGGRRRPDQDSRRRASRGDGPRRDHGRGPRRAGTVRDLRRLAISCPLPDSRSA